MIDGLDSSAHRRTPLTKLAALWLAPAAFFFAAAALTLAFHNPVLVQDGWEIVPYWDAVQRNALRPSDLFISHNGHWIVATRLLLLTVYQLTQMSHLAEAVMNIVACGLAGLALFAMLARAANRADGKPKFPLILGLAAFFVFSLDQAPNLLWGWQIAVFLNLLGALIAIWLLARADLRWPVVVAAAVATTLSVYDYAIGFVMLPVGFLLIFCAPAVPRGRRIPMLLFWALFSAALIAQYVVQVVNTGQLVLSSEGPGTLNLPAMAIYALTFLGGAVGRFSDGLALPIAVVGLGAAAFALARLLQSGTNREALMAPVALMLYAAGGGLITAAGRVSFGIDQALVSRYISFSNLFWIGALTLAIFASATLASKVGRRSLGTFVVLIVLLKLGNVANVVIDKDVPGDHERLVQAARHLRKEYPVNPRPPALAAVTAPTQPASDWVPILYRDRVSVFRGVPKQ